MRTFKDKDGQEWHLDLTFGKYRRLHASGFDCTDVGQLERLASDPEVTLRVLMELCSDDLASRNVSQEVFESGFDLDVLQAAIEAVVDEIIDFFPQQSRAVMRTAWEKVRSQMATVQQDMAKAATKAIENGEIESQVEKALSEQFSN